MVSAPVFVQNAGFAGVYRMFGVILVPNAYDSPTDWLFDDANPQKPDPFELFESWMEEARQNEINDPNAMSLATVDREGMPDVRMVLLNGIGPDGFVFFTNTESAKGEELAAHPKAALLFHWKSVRRQVRVRGPVTPVPPEEADAYFAKRPRGSQIGAHASAQSRELGSREELVAKVDRLTAGFEGADVPRPSHWSGYRITPLQIEFWQNGEFRLHDRILYSRFEPGTGWTTRRLNP